MNSGKILRRIITLSLVACLAACTFYGYAYYVEQGGKDRSVVSMVGLIITIGKMDDAINLLLEDSPEAHKIDYDLLNTSLSGVVERARNQPLMPKTISANLGEAAKEVKDKVKSASTLITLLESKAQSKKTIEQHLFALVKGANGLSKSMAQDKSSPALMIHNLHIITGLYATDIKNLLNDGIALRDASLLVQTITKRSTIVKRYITDVVGAISSRKINRTAPMVESLKAIESNYLILNGAVQDYIASSEKIKIYADSLIFAQEQLRVMTELSKKIYKPGGDIEKLNLVAMLLMGVITLVFLQLFTSNNTDKTAALAATADAELSRRSATTKQEQFTEILEQLAKINEGDLSVEIKGGDGNNIELIDGLNQTVKNIRLLVSETKTMTVNIASASEQTARTSQEVERTKESQLRAVESSAEMTFKVDETVDRINNLMVETTKLAEDTEAKVRVGESVVDSSHESVVQVGNELQEIMNNVKTMIDSVQGLNVYGESIEEISKKIKMLSFNVQLQASNLDGKENTIMSSTADEMTQCAEGALQALNRITETVNGVISQATETQLVLERGHKQIGVITDRSGQTRSTFQEIKQSSKEVINGSSNVVQETGKLKVLMNQMVQAISSIKTSAESSASVSAETALAISGVNHQSEELSTLLANYRTE